MGRPSLKLAALLLFAGPRVLSAQADAGALAERFIRMTAITGLERAALDSVERAIPGSRRDRAGNVVFGRGTGPATLIACPFDEAGYVVGGIRDDGWLTLRRVGRAPGPLYDQYHEGQRIMLFGANGARPGVIAVHSTHLQRGRGGNEAPFNVDDAFVDVGAASAAEARAAGVRLLAPVAALKQVTRYGDGLLAGPYAGRRSACAAVVGALDATTGPVVVAFLVEQELGQRGLRTMAHEGVTFTRTILVDGAPGAVGAITERNDTTLAKAFPALGAVSRLSLPTRHQGTPVETVSLADVAAFRAQLVAKIGGGR